MFDSSRRLGDKWPTRNLATAADVLPKLQKPYFSVCSTAVGDLETSGQPEIWPLQLMCFRNYEKAVLFGVFDSSRRLGDKWPARNLATAADVFLKLRKPYYSAKCDQQIFGKTKNHENFWFDRKK